MGRAGIGAGLVVALLASGGGLIASAQEETAQAPSIQLAPPLQLAPTGQESPSGPGIETQPGEMAPSEVEELGLEELPPQTEEQIQAMPMISATGEVVEVRQFGHYERRLTPRPYQGIDPLDLDPVQREAAEDWEKNPYVLVWVYDVLPGPENNWAGWGPPPPGWEARDASGRVSPGKLPWPPPGEPNR